VIRTQTALITALVVILATVLFKYRPSLWEIVGLASLGALAIAFVLRSRR
jgi:hypothetical protein